MTLSRNYKTTNPTRLRYHCATSHLVSGLTQARTGNTKKQLKIRKYQDHEFSWIPATRDYFQLGIKKLDFIDIYLKHLLLSVIENFYLILWTIRQINFLSLYSREVKAKVNFKILQFSFLKSLPKAYNDLESDDKI